MAADKGLRKLAAILAADVAGYSRLMADDERATVDTLTDYREVFTELVEAHQGRIVDTAGDSVLATFDSVVEAVEAAVEIQRMLSEHNEALPDHRRMHFRIGVNLGDIIVRGDGTVYGDGVNVAARLESLSEPGGTMVSQTAYDHVEGKLDVSLIDVGEHEVKNIAKPVRAYRVLLDGSDGAMRRGAAKASRRRTNLVAGLVAGLAILVGLAVWGITIRVEVPQMVKADGTPTDDPVLAMPTGPTIAVLPFDNMSGDPEKEYFADGLTEEIITELTHFADLQVIARNSSFRYKGQASDVRQVGSELGARYILEGSVRQSRDAIRVTAQLLDARDGTHVWAETYERDLTSVSVFAIQDDIKQNVAGAIGASHGVIARSDLLEAARKAPGNLSAYECVLKAAAFIRSMDPEEHETARDCLEQSVESDPDYAEAWAWLAQLYLIEHFQWINPLPNPLERALNAAETAVSLDPTSALTHYNLAVAVFFLGDRTRFLAETDRALSINSNDTEVLSGLSNFLAFMGEADRAIQLMDKAFKLNADTPAVTYYGYAAAYFQTGRYREAIVASNRTEVPDWHWTHIYPAAAYAQLGELKEARRAVQEIYRTYPGFTLESARKELAFWQFPKNISQVYVDSLRIAGVPEAAPQQSRPVIAVLPFDNMSGDPEQEYFADGITEDIITRLSRFSDLAVIARNSSFQYQGEAVDVVSVGKTLGAGYIVEGSVRRSESRIRVTAQLLAANDATHLWAESYDRDLSAGDVFDIQDEITDAIVGVIAGVHGVIARTSAASARQRPATLDSYDCVLLAYAYDRQATAEGFHAAKSCLDTALTREADYVDGLSAFTYVAADGYGMGWGMAEAERDALLDEALTAGQRAVALAPDDANSHWTLAYADFVSGDVASFHAHAERALALNPNNADVMGYAGTLFAFSGQYDRGLELIEAAMTRNPHHPEWWNFGVTSAHWSNGRNAEALTAIRKVNQPDNFWMHIWQTIIFAEVGDTAAAAAALAELERTYPGFTVATYRDEVMYWQVTPDFIGRAVKALRKAGLPEGNE